MNIDAKILKKKFLTNFGFIQSLQGFFSFQKSSNVIQHIKKLKDKNYMIISIDTEKFFEKIHPFMIKTLKKWAWKEPTSI